MRPYLDEHVPLEKIVWKDPRPRQFGPLIGSHSMRPPAKFVDKRNMERVVKPCEWGPHEDEHCPECARTGTLYNSGCRCDPCRDAHAIRCLRAKDLRSKLLEEDPTLAPHGKVSTYRNWSCRCPACTEAHSAMCKIGAEKRKDPNYVPRHKQKAS